MKSLNGEIFVPGDKSISHRAAIIGSLARGETIIENFLEAADPQNTLGCIEALGISVRRSGGKIIIHGKGRHGYSAPHNCLDAGNSGTTIRLMSGILAAQSFASTITGDQYLVRRPMKRIIDPLQKMGADISGTGDGKAPLHFSPVDGLRAISYDLPIPSAQIKSAVLLAGLFAKGETSVRESIPSRDHTERMLDLPVTLENGVRVVRSSPDLTIEPRHIVVPGDPSSAAFFVTAASTIPNSEIIIRNVGNNPTRSAYLTFLRSVHGSISYENERIICGEPIVDLKIKYTPLSGDINISGSVVPLLIDEIPILAVAAALGKCNFSVCDAKELRTKECDRITAICQNLTAMGIDVEEYADGFAFVSNNDLIPSDFKSFGDHRIAMAFGIAGIVLSGQPRIDDVECVNISYPSFWETFKKLTK